ncbi:diguanylate cyclase domain-containing protein [Kineococcus gynurae]
MAAVSDRDQPTAGGMTTRRTAVLLVAVLLGPATLVVLQLLHQEADWAVAAASTVMSVLVVLRMGMALRAVAASLAAREEMRRGMEHQATHDALTGLVNRAASTELLSRVLHAAREGHPAVALLFVDLDGFKGVNDTHGHRAGDDVLREVAVRLTDAVRDGDVAGRLGGDEFVVVLVEVQDVQEVLTVAQRVVARVTEPIVTDGHVVRVGASVGAVVSGAGSEPAALLHEADTAVYRAKALGRGRVEFYDHELRAADAARAAVEDDLRRTWPEAELTLPLAPVVLPSPSSPAPAPIALLGRVAWARPEGDVGPDALVAAVEKAGRTHDLGRWALSEALRRHGGGPHDPAVWVSVPPAHAADARFVEEVTAALDTHGTAPLTLGVLTGGPEVLGAPGLRTTLRALRDLGVGVVLEGLTAQTTRLGDLAALPASALLLRAEDLPDEGVLTLFVRSARSCNLVVVVEGEPRAELSGPVRALGLPVVGTSLAVCHPG